MLHSSRRGKGRRLQVELAEALSVRFGLTIEAVPPTKPGQRASGAVYVPESAGPDLRVRRMGEPGADVALLTAEARRMVALGGRPCRLECKNVERLDLGSADWWRGGGSPVILQALRQARAARTDHETPVAVVARNRFPAQVVWLCDRSLRSGVLELSFVTLVGSVAVAPVEQWLRVLDGAQ